jgi:hypothetical protein
MCTTFVQRKCCISCLGQSSRRANYTMYQPRAETRRENGREGGRGREREREREGGREREREREFAQIIRFIIIHRPTFVKLPLLHSSFGSLQPSGWKSRVSAALSAIYHPFDRSFVDEETDSSCYLHRTAYFMMPRFVFAVCERRANDTRDPDASIQPHCCSPFDRQSTS